MATHTFMLITPELAADMLKRNTRNRTLSSKRVSILAGLHGTPHWRQTGDTIKFSNDGTLLDGQHRLAAIVKSGIPVEYLVIYGVDPRAQLVMDTGQRRNFAHQLQIHGVKNAKTAASVTRLAVAWTKGIRHFKGLGPDQVSITESDEFYWSHPELNEASSKANRYGQRFPHPPAIYGFLSWLFDQIDEEDSEHFFDQLTSEFGHEATSPISQLRMMWKSDREESTNQKSSVRGTTWQIGVAIKAWNLYRTGQEVKVLRFSQGGSRPEKFPEPI